ncbi:MAG: YggT family protein [Chloroflexi bacterium]|nr:YggT family protein [Chloroflexota bacterium]
MLLQFVIFLCQALSIAIVVRAVLSWFPISQTNPAIVFLNYITDPIMVPLRRLLPQVGMFDFSPIVAIIILYVIQVVAQSAL